MNFPWGIGLEEWFTLFPSKNISFRNMAFQFCNELTSVLLPSSLVRIGKYAFGGCDKLSSILVQDNDVPSIKKLLSGKMRKFVKPLSK